MVERDPDDEPPCLTVAQYAERHQTTPGRGPGAHPARQSSTRSGRRAPAST